MGDQTTHEDRFIRAMKAAREARGMTQNQLARTLRDEHGLPFQQQTIQRLETGQRPVRLNEAFAIAEALGSTLIEMTEDPKTAVGQALEAARSAEEVLASVGPAISELKRAVMFLGSRLDDEWVHRTDPALQALHLSLIHATDLFEPREVEAQMAYLRNVVAKGDAVAPPSGVAPRTQVATHDV